MMRQRGGTPGSAVWFVAGTLGVLLKAKQTGHLARVRTVIEQREACRFFLDAQTRAAVLRLGGDTLDATVARAGEG